MLTGAACWGQQVTRQLFEPLVMQLIHWFTNNRKFESRDTVAVLEAIMVGSGSLQSGVVLQGAPHVASAPVLRVAWSTQWTARCETSPAAASKSL